MPIGHYNEDGSFTERNQIRIALWKEETPTRWIHQCGSIMYLHPMSKDITDPNEFYWKCNTCNISITIPERNKAWEEVKAHMKSEYNLKTLDYIKEERRLEIESAQFVGSDRLDSKRKVISGVLKDEIVDTILYGLKSRLGISIEDSLEDYFRE